MYVYERRMLSENVLNIYNSPDSLNRFLIKFFILKNNRN